MRIGQSIRQKCLTVLEKNWREGKNFGYTCPGGWKYPHQWLWDSCFAAIIWSKISPGRAKEELETLLSSQKPNGFIPHIVKWPSSRASNLTQPPIIALALEEVYKNTGDLIFLQRNLPKVEKYFSWLSRERDPDADGLVFIVHPWESTDASPTLVKTSSVFLGYWQLYSNLWQKNFQKIDILFNCLYAQGLRCLARLTRNQKYHLLADKSEKKIMSLPDDGTASSLLPIIFEDIPQQKIDKIVNRLKDPVEFGLPYPIPFVAKNNPAFDPNYHGLLWRGPTWININWLIIRGLVLHRQKKMARILAEKSTELIKKGGLWEFYNPITGRGQGQKDYTWSALVLDLEI